MVSYVGANFTSRNPVTSLSIECLLPSGIQDGDRHLGFCLYGDQPANELLGAPVGWNAIDASNANSSSQVSVVWAAHSPSLASLTWTLDDVDLEASGLNKLVAGVLTFRDSADPIASSAQEGTGTSSTAPGLTTSTDGSIVVALHSAKVSSIGAITGPAGFTQRVSQVIGGGGGTAIWMGTQAYPTGGTATGDQVATNTLAGALWYARLIEFPAPSAIPNASWLRWTGTAFVEQEVILG